MNKTWKMYRKGIVKNWPELRGFWFGDGRGDGIKDCSTTRLLSFHSRSSLRKLNVIILLQNNRRSACSRRRKVCYTSDVVLCDDECTRSTDTSSWRRSSVSRHSVLYAETSSGVCGDKVINAEVSIKRSYKLGLENCQGVVSHVGKRSPCGYLINVH